MTLSVKQQHQRKFAEVRAALARPTLVHLVSTIAVHEPAPAGSKPCRCCGSSFARVAEEIDDGEVLINRSTGRRIWPHELKPATWAKAVSLAERHDIVFRVSRDQYPLLVDETDKHQLIAGTHRSGKSTIALLGTVRDWLRRGGPLRRFWFVAPTLTDAFELVKTVFEGDGLAPPILPECLAVRRPRTSKAGDTNTIMLDGSIWQLRSFGADPTAARNKSRPIVAGCVDEAAEMKHENALTALTGRCLDLRGKLRMATTPVGGSFLKPKIVEKCEEWTRLPDDHDAKRTGSHIGALWSSVSLTLLRNPWEDPVSVARDIAGQDQDSPSYKRDYLGMWVTDRGKMWVYEDDRHTIVHEGRSVQNMMAVVNLRARGGAYQKRGEDKWVWKWGYDADDKPLPERPQKRITEDVARRLFQNSYNPAFQSLRATNLAYLLGTDVNSGRRAMNTVVVEVTADAKEPNNTDRWHYWVLDVKQTWQGNAYTHAQELAGMVWARKWGPHLNESPYKGCGMIMDPQAIFNNPHAHLYGGNPRGVVELYGDLGFDVRAPEFKLDGITPVAHVPKRDSHDMVARLLHEGRLHISHRCAMNLIKSFHAQEKGEKDGYPEENDDLAGPVDGLRYLLWAIKYSGMTR